MGGCVSISIKDNSITQIYPEEDDDIVEAINNNANEKCCCCTLKYIKKLFAVCI